MTTDHNFFDVYVYVYDGMAEQINYFNIFSYILSSIVRYLDKTI